ncbi:MAG: hypothetical protein ABI596_13130 [Pyrinomonadaceae bacterium]
MTTSYDDYAYDEYMSELGREEELRQAIEGISIENASWYLGTFGDALEQRVRALIDEAKTLAKLGHSGPSVVLCASALELIVRYFVLKPLVSGTFLKDIWADLLVDKLVSGQSSRDRELLPLIASEWGIDLESIKLMNGTGAWAFFKSDLVQRRNAFIHKGEAVQPEFSLKAVECAEVLFDGLLTRIARKFQLGWPESGAWHKPAMGTRGSFYKPCDPFQ